MSSVFLHPHPNKIPSVDSCRDWVGSRKCSAGAAHGFNWLLPASWGKVGREGREAAGEGWGRREQEGTQADLRRNFALLVCPERGGRDTKSHKGQTL